jgi:hypothetical protein
MRQDRKPGADLREARWTELVELSTSPSAGPVLRRRAERILASRLEGLAEGERIAIARRAGRGLFEFLVEGKEARVLNALVSNPRLVEADALRLASDEDSPAETLACVARDPRWGSRRAVRLALLRNPGTPVPVALRVLGELPARDLQLLSADPGAPRIVRVGAERALRKPRDGSPRSSRLSPSGSSANNRSGPA